MNIKRKFIVWWAKFYKFPYCQPKSRKRFREINRGLARNRKHVKKIMASLAKIK